ncbi:siroheme synthase protein [Rutstroemia sp. NJR-2017a BVV2]|nr:siroheme synthase protein [Rutstroemia sp. NJR-2017a BVV2]
MAPEPGFHRYPLFNTTFTLHRVSPLYVGDQTLDNSNLREHAQRFRDILVGDVLRGVRVGLGSEDDSLARVGVLQTVTWQTLRRVDEWQLEDSSDVESGASQASAAHSSGIIFEVNYEKATYIAILLRATVEDENEDSIIQPTREKDGFLHLPLLLTRMPLSLRETFIQYMSRTFDTRLSPLRLDGTYLTAAFEKFVSDSLAEDHTDHPQDTLQKMVKETQLSIAFDVPGGSTALKMIEIHIAREDLPRMIARGKKMTKDKSPFMAALRVYIQSHLALDLTHERVKIVKIACGAFVLGDGKLKLTQPPNDENGNEGQRQAARQLINGLINTAGKRLLPEVQ